jgi:hypothetical protein
MTKKSTGASVGLPSDDGRFPAIRGQRAMAALGRLRPVDRNSTCSSERNEAGSQCHQRRSDNECDILPAREGL